MASYLVVAHQTAASPELINKLREISASDSDAEFVLLVPATPPAHLLTWVEGARDEIARRRAAEATLELRRNGFSVIEALVGPADPLQAIKAEHDRGRRDYAVTVISTLPPGLSRWLRRDLANQVRTQLGLAVTQVVASSSAEKTNSLEAGSTGRRTGPTSVDEANNPSPLSLPDLSLLRGSRLDCVDGVLGRVREVIYDYVSLEPIWLGVDSHPLPFRTLLVPVSTVFIDGDHLKTGLTREKILGQPDVSIGEGGASLTDEERLFHHFGLQFELRDLRVLRTGQPLPGMEQNQQSIFEAEQATRP